MSDFDPAIVRLQQASGHTVDHVTALAAMSSESGNAPPAVHGDNLLFHASSAGAYMSFMA